MNFRRTASGLSNMYLFLGVDAVIFVEGGESISKQDVLAGNGGISIDVLFWRKMFETFCSNKNLSFKAVGSKTTLLDIANDIQAGIAKNVCVAMDRDFDNLKGTMKNSANIFYTSGYSWENDVWNEDTVEDIFYELCPIDRTTAVRLEIDRYLQEFDRYTRWLIYGDAILSFYNLSLIPRGREGQLVDQKSVSIKRDKILEIIRNIKTSRGTPYLSNQGIGSLNRNDCCGHLIGIYFRRLLQFLIKNFYKSINLDNDIANSWSINKFFERFKGGQYRDLLNYYDMQFKVATIC